MKRPKCGALCREYMGGRTPENIAYCQRALGHAGPHRSATREWYDGKGSTPRKYPKAGAE